MENIQLAHIKCSYDRSTCIGEGKVWNFITCIIWHAYHIQMLFPRKNLESICISNFDLSFCDFVV